MVTGIDENDSRDDENAEESNQSDSKVDDIRLQDCDSSTQPVPATDDN